VDHGDRNRAPSVVDAVNAAVKVLLATAVQAPGSPYLHKDAATLR